MVLDQILFTNLPNLNPILNYWSHTKSKMPAGLYFLGYQDWDIYFVRNQGKPNWIFSINRGQTIKSKVRNAENTIFKMLEKHI